MKKITSIIPSLFVIILSLSIWEIIVQTGLIGKSFLPAPSETILALISHWDIISTHAWQTFLETIIGIIIAIILGVTIAVLLDMSPLIRRAIYPLLIASQTIPTIALAPLLLIWFGFGILPKVIIVVLCCFFPIAIATLSGFASVELKLLHLLQSMRANYLQSLWYVKLPGSLPQFFAGLKIAATYSVTGAVVGEYVGAYQGLGIYMQTVAHSYAIVLVFAVIIVISSLSLSLFLLVLYLERIFVPWKR